MIKPVSKLAAEAWIEGLGEVLIELKDNEIARLTARVEELEKTLFFVERWAVYKRYKPDRKNLTAEEAIGIIAFHPAIRDITKRYEAAGEIDVAAYERDRAAITKGESNG